MLGSKVGLFVAGVIAMTVMSAPAAVGRQPGARTPVVERGAPLSEVLAPKEADSLVLERVSGLAADNIYYIKNLHTAKCLTVYGASKANGATVNQYACVGARNQWWEITFDDDIWYRLRNVNSFLCLSVAGASTSNGAKTIQWTCNGRNDQKFYPQDSPLKARHSGKCLDVQGGSAANNAAVIQWTCNGKYNQGWYKSG